MKYYIEYYIKKYYIKKMKACKLTTNQATNQYTVCSKKLRVFMTLFMSFPAKLTRKLDFGW